MAHVRDVDAELDHPVAQLARVDRVVEVLGVDGVNRKDGILAQVQPPRDFLLGDPGLDARGGLLDLWRERGLGAVRHRECEDGHAGRVGAAEVGQDAALWRGFRVVETVDAHHDFVARGGAVPVVARHVHVVAHARVVGLHPPGLARDLERADGLRRLALDHLQNLALAQIAGRSVLVGGREADPHAVAVERGAHAVLAHEHVVSAFVQRDEPVAAGDDLERSLGGVLCAAVTVLNAPFADVLGHARVLHLAEHGLEDLEPAVVLDAERLGDLLRAVRLVLVGLEEREGLLAEGGALAGVGHGGEEGRGKGDGQRRRPLALAICVLCAHRRWPLALAVAVVYAPEAGRGRYLV